MCDHAHRLGMKENECILPTADVKVSIWRKSVRLELSRVFMSGHNNDTHTFGY